MPASIPLIADESVTQQRVLTDIIGAMFISIKRTAELASSGDSPMNTLKTFLYSTVFVKQRGIAQAEKDRDHNQRKAPYNTVFRNFSRREKFRTKRSGA